MKKQDFNKLQYFAEIKELTAAIRKKFNGGYVRIYSEPRVATIYRTKIYCVFHGQQKSMARFIKKHCPNFNVEIHGITLTGYGFSRYPSIVITPKQ
jgi:hypothetical protein